ncbi:uncharacterized protein LOC106182006 [Lingula anatina]|uniref:Uncharacterized protein LOC106182006 n=1 Tax=Lingula anatina TaxID=7574 RepID=A0A1S3KHY6_LINAN|nr:uncharacterized protein LOC106182006 [Lingula anatina]|eukprot:XP_013422107.1 uncharacterized protein LOC106182006 [Lingula anatina]
MRGIHRAILSSFLLLSVFNVNVDVVNTTETVTSYFHVYKDFLWQIETDPRAPLYEELSTSQRRNFLGCLVSCLDTVNCGGGHYTNKTCVLVGVRKDNETIGKCLGTESIEGTKSFLKKEINDWCKVVLASNISCPIAEYDSVNCTNGGSITHLGITCNGTVTTSFNGSNVGKPGKSELLYLMEISPWVARVEIDTCRPGTDYDSMLAVGKMPQQVNSTTCLHTDYVSFNDDGYTCDLESWVTVTSPEAGCYFVAVHGYRGNSGTFELHISC